MTDHLCGVISDRAEPQDCVRFAAYVFQSYIRLKSPFPPSRTTPPVDEDARVVVEGCKRALDAVGILDERLALAARGHGGAQQQLGGLLGEQGGGREVKEGEHSFPL
jgi:hypothetical protein